MVMKIDKFENFNNGSIVIAGFPGIGKSHLKSIGGDKVIDINISEFNKEEFPENCVDYIQSILGEKEIIIVPAHRDILIEMERVGINYILIYPDRSLKSEYLERYKGNKFADSLSKKWDSFMNNVDSANPNKRIILKSGEYIKDKLNLLYL